MRYLLIFPQLQTNQYQIVRQNNISPKQKIRTYSILRSFQSVSTF